MEDRPALTSIPSDSNGGAGELRRGALMAAAPPTAEPWSPELAGDYADMLGIPPDAFWERHWTPDPIPSGKPPIRWRSQTFIPGWCPVDHPGGPHYHRASLGQSGFGPIIDALLRDSPGHH